MKWNEWNEMNLKGQDIDTFEWVRTVWFDKDLNSLSVKNLLQGSVCFCTFIPLLNFWKVILVTQIWQLSMQHSLHEEWSLQEHSLRIYFSAIIISYHLGYLQAIIYTCNKPWYKSLEEESDLWRKMRNLWFYHNC